MSEIEETLNSINEKEAKKMKLKDIQCLTCNSPHCNYLGEILNVQAFTIEYKAFCCLDLPSEYITKPITKWVCCDCADLLKEQKGDCV